MWPLCACVCLSAVAVQQLRPLMLVDRKKKVGAKHECAIKSPFLPCTVFKPDTSDRLVQRLSYMGNAATGALVRMDLYAQFTTIRNAINLQIIKRNDAFQAAAGAARAAIQPFDPSLPEGRNAVMTDLGIKRKNRTEYGHFLTYFDEYLAIVKWGATPANPAAPKRYVDRVNFDQFTTDVSKAVHKAVVARSS
jgi:hypothetical protein